MINITNEQKGKLKQYIENIDELIQGDDVNDLLLAIDDVIVNNILGNDDEPNEVGIEIQKIYDQIFDQN